MTRGDEFDYYEAYKKQIAYAEEIVLNLRSATKAGELGTPELMAALHTVENDADQVNHVIQAHLREDSAVPMERAGMSVLANRLDDVSDAFEDVSIRAYYFHVDALSEGGEEVLDRAAEAVRSLKRAIGMLSDRENEVESIQEQLIAVQTAESDCDALYIRAVHGIYGDKALGEEPRRISHAMLSSLEDAMDALEHAAECVELTVEENL